MGDKCIFAEIAEITVEHEEAPLLLECWSPPHCAFLGLVGVSVKCPAVTHEGPTDAEALASLEEEPPRRAEVINVTVLASSGNTR